MRIAITGASGFIGKRVVAEALKQGYAVRAILRDRSRGIWPHHPMLEIIEANLLHPANLSDALAECDALVHLAAVLEGPKQYDDTMQSTRNVLDAMDKANIKTLIGFSSISVLDYSSLAPMSEVDEKVRTSGNDAALGPYAKMKRDQEALFRDWQSGDKELIILRPGLVYDKEHLSPAHVGFKFIASEHCGEVPLVHVDSVASATIAALKNKGHHQVFHLINDNPPNQEQYIRRLKEANKIGSTLPLPWKSYALLMTLFRIPLQLVGRTPDAMRSNSVAARQKPFKFSNRLAKQYLKWHPQQGLRA